MKIIDDKEVGEIWNQVKYSSRFGRDQAVKQLIRGLVAERAMRKMVGWKGTDWTEGFDASLAIALSDFGIDPIDWKDDD